MVLEYGYVVNGSHLESFKNAGACTCPQGFWFN